MNKMNLERAIRITKERKARFIKEKRLVYGKILNIGFNQLPNPLLGRCDGYDINITNKVPDNYDFVSEKFSDFKDKEYDSVLAGAVIEHIVNLGEWLKNVNRVLKIAGIFVFSTPSPYYIGDLLHYWFKIKQSHNQHIISLTPNNVDNLMLRFGFVKEKVISNGFYLPKIYINIQHRVPIFIQKYIYVYKKVKDVENYLKGTFIDKTGEVN